MRINHLLLLLSALIFSSVIRLKFNLYDGLEFHGLRVTMPLPILGTGNSSNPNNYLDTTFAGYLIYIYYGFMVYRNSLRGSTAYKAATILLIVSTGSTAYEFVNIFSDINSHYEGCHFYCGPLLFVMALFAESGIGDAKAGNKDVI